MPSPEALGHVLIFVALTVTFLTLLAYHFVSVRNVVRMVFAFIQHVLEEVERGLRHVARSITSALPVVRRQLTHDDRFPLPLLVVAVAVLTPVLLLLVVVEVRLWGAYFESLFPEQIELPLIGEVAGGTLTAMMPVAGGLLLGWLLDALVGVFPLPLLGAATTQRDRARVRGLLAIGVLVLWMLLVASVFNAANEVYDGLGESSCALRYASETRTPDAVFGAAPSDTGAGLTADPETVSAQAACVAEWKANDRARAIRVILGVLTLHLTALLSWVVIDVVALPVLLALFSLALAFGLGAWIFGLACKLVGTLLELTESVLQMGRLLGATIVGGFGWIGLPPAPDKHAADGMSDAAERAALPNEHVVGPSVPPIGAAERSYSANGSHATN